MPTTKWTATRRTPKADLAALAGTWVVVAQVESGEKSDVTEGAFEVDFDEKQATIRIGAGTGKLGFRIDPTTKPNIIDFTPESSEAGEKPWKGSVARVHQAAVIGRARTPRRIRLEARLRHRRRHAQAERDISTATSESRNNAGVAKRTMSRGTRPAATDGRYYCSAKKTPHSGGRILPLLARADSIGF
jgi:uncharacterized protein (TIGR03067 family)